jgi:glycosyltransferase involved in cell wall biosynthesis
MRKLDLLVLKFNAWDRASFLKEVIDYSENSMVFIFDFEKIMLEYKPADIDFPIETIRYKQTKMVNRSRFLLAFFSSLDIAIFMFFFLYLCIKFRPKVCWMDNTWPAVVTGIMRVFGFCGYSIYTPSDWLVNDQKKISIRNLANNLLWPVMDYFACRLNDNVLNLTDEIGKARIQYWGTKVTKRESTHSRLICLKNSDVQTGRNKIGFLGRVLSDSGLELVILTLKRKAPEKKIILKIIGPVTPHSKRLKQFIKEHEADDLVEICDFVEAGKLQDCLSDCFCGVNLISVHGGHTAYTIPGKMIEYLQNFMPVLVTNFIGNFYKIIEDNQLGLVINPTEEEIFKAIEHLYKQQQQYIDHINKFVGKYSVGKIEDYIVYD